MAMRDVSQHSLTMLFCIAIVGGLTFMMVQQARAESLLFLLIPPLLSVGEVPATAMKIDPNFCINDPKSAMAQADASCFLIQSRVAG